MSGLRFTKTPSFYSRLSLACGYVGLSQRAHGRVALETRRTNSQLPFNRFSERNRKTKLLPKLAAYPRNELKRVVVEASQEKLSQESRDGMTACRRGGNRRPAPAAAPAPPRPAPPSPLPAPRSRGLRAGRRRRGGSAQQRGCHGAEWADGAMRGSSVSPCPGAVPTATDTPRRPGHRSTRGARTANPSALRTRGHPHGPSRLPGAACPSSH